MTFGSSLLIEALFPVRLSGGGPTLLPLAEALARKDAVAIASGHPYVDAVANNFVVCALQTFFAPGTDAEWVDLLAEPPPVDRLAQTFGAWADVFDLRHPERPFMQVRFVDGPSKKPARAPRLHRLGGIQGDAGEDGDEDDETGELSPLVRLLPDETSKNQMKRSAGGAHFAKEGRIRDLGAFAAGMLLSGINLFGIGGGGGYYKPGHQGAALARVSFPEVAGAGHVLWRSAWANVHALDHPGVRRARGEPTNPETLFGWCAPSLRRSRGKSEVEDNAAAAVSERGAVIVGGREVPLHPMFFMWAMCRRAELAEPSEGKCDLTGARGPVWSSVELQPGGGRFAISPTSWHPLIGLRPAPKKNASRQSRVVNPGPPSGVVRSPDWVGLVPLGDNDTGEERGLPPAVAGVGQSLRAGAIRDVLARCMPEYRRSPIPVHVLVLRQTHVLKGWSEATLSLFADSPCFLLRLHALLRSLQEGAKRAGHLRQNDDRRDSGVAEAVRKAIHSHAPQRRSGSDAKGFGGGIRAWIIARSETLHDAVGRQAIQSLLDLHASASNDGADLEDAFAKIVESLPNDLDRATRQAVSEADYTVLGGPIVRATALLAADLYLSKAVKKSNPKSTR